MSDLNPNLPSRHNGEWNAEVALDLFTKYGLLQYESGITTAYIKAFNARVQTDIDLYGESDLEPKIAYAEMPLAVLPQDSMDMSEDRLHIYLIKINPANGETITNSMLSTGFEFDEFGTLTQSPYCEDTPFTLEHATIIYGQFFDQEMADLRYV